MNINKNCWINLVGGIILIILAYFANSIFVGILGGINLGYFIGGLVITNHLRKSKLRGKKK